jgi:hypothetical protein
LSCEENPLARLLCFSTLNILESKAHFGQNTSKSRRSPRAAWRGILARDDRTGSRPGAVNREEDSRRGPGCLPDDGGNMHHLELTDEELNVLRETLGNHVEEMRVELAHTDTHEFKRILKHRLEVLEHIHSHLDPEMQKVVF